MKYVVKYTTKFKKDYKNIQKRGYNVELLTEVIRILASGETLPEKYKDHALTGDYIGYRDCHILNDWVLIYRIDNDIVVLTLTRTGTHSDLF